MDSITESSRVEDVLAAEAALPEEEWPLIPMLRPCYGEAELGAVQLVCKSRSTGLGPMAAEFDKVFDVHIGVLYGESSAMTRVDSALADKGPRRMS